MTKLFSLCEQNFLGWLLVGYTPFCLNTHDITHSPCSLSTAIQVVSPYVFKKNKQTKPKFSDHSAV